MCLCAVRFKGTPKRNLWLSHWIKANQQRKWILLVFARLHEWRRNKYIFANRVEQWTLSVVGARTISNANVAFSEMRILQATVCYGKWCFAFSILFILLTMVRSTYWCVSLTSFVQFSSGFLLCVTNKHVFECVFVSTSCRNINFQPNIFRLKIIIHFDDDSCLKR